MGKAALSCLHAEVYSCPVSSKNLLSWGGFFTSFFFYPLLVACSSSLQGLDLVPLSHAIIHFKDFHGGKVLHPLNRSRDEGSVHELLGHRQARFSFVFCEVIAATVKKYAQIFPFAPASMGG